MFYNFNNINNIKFIKLNVNKFSQLNFHHLLLINY